MDLDHGNGDDDFVAWYAVAAREVLASLAVLSGDRSAAEEATSEAFIRAYARWPQVSQMERRNGWVFKVALNELRSSKRRRRRELLADPVAREPWQSLSGHDPELWAAVAALPKRTRQVVVLRYVADLPEADIAAALGVTRGTVATLLSRARRNLAVVLGDDYLETCR
jgi:RNA polymerase sigma-70 factor (ECF subfamily)